MTDLFECYFEDLIQIWWSSSPSLLLWIIIIIIIIIIISIIIGFQFWESLSKLIEFSQFSNYIVPGPELRDFGL